MPSNYFRVGENVALQWAVFKEKMKIHIPVYTKDILLKIIVWVIQK
jgi:hypothetical protein